MFSWFITQNIPSMRIVVRTRYVSLFVPGLEFPMNGSGSYFKGEDAYFSPTPIFPSTLTHMIYNYSWKFHYRIMCSLSFVMVTCMLLFVIFSLHSPIRRP
jgi:hypothetical protein